MEANQEKLAKMDTSKLCRCWLTLECILDLYANCSYAYPLHSAIIDDNYKVVKYLLENHQGIGLDATVKRWLWLPPYFSMKALKDFYDAMLHWRHSSPNEIIGESNGKCARNQCQRLNVVETSTTSTKDEIALRWLHIACF